MSEPTTKKEKKRRTWKQRLKLTAIVVIVAALLIRAGVNLLLPTVVRKVANSFDLDCEYERMSLNVISGNANIWGLVLKPKAGGESIVRTDYIHGSVSVPNLLRGRLVVYRAEVDGVDMLIDREPDGGIPLLKRFGSANPAPTPRSAPAKVATGDKPEPLNLQSPLRIDAVRLSHVSTTFRDRSVSPTFQTTVRTTFRLSDVGNPDQAAKMELAVEADPVLDEMAVQGVVHNTPTSLEADLSLHLRGVHPKPAAPYLLPLGLKPIADDLTVRGAATVKINVIPNSTDFAGQISVTDIAATANSAEWASLKSIAIELKKLNATGAELSAVKIDQGRASARRSDSGAVQVAGFELVPVAAATDATAPPPAASMPAPAQAVTTTGTAFRASLDELKLTDLQATFDDRAVRPAADLTARLDELSLKDIVFDPAKPDAAVKISGAASLPGVIKAVTWAGTAAPFARTRTAELAVRAGGIQPTALKPYLEPLGVSSDFKDGVFTANLSASVGDKTDAKVSDVKLTDGAATLLELPAASLKGFAVAPDGLIRVESVDVTGPTVGLRREADGSFTGVGVRIRPTTQPAAAPAVAAGPTTQPAPAVAARKGGEKLVLPRLRIDRTVCHDIRLQFDDRGDAGQEPFTIALTAGAELNDLLLDTTSGRPAGKPGGFNAWATAPGFFQKLGAKGTLDPTGEGLSTALAFYGQGLSGKLISRYLKPLGIEIVLENGQVQGNLSAAVALTDDGLTAKLDLTDVSYADGESELAGVEALHVAGLELKPGKIDLASVQVVKPRARLTREADGTLQAGGVHLLPPPPMAPVPLPAAPAPPAPLRLPAVPVALSLGQFSLTEGRLAFTDRAFTPATETALHGSVKLDHASLSPQDPPALLDISGGIDGIIGKATVSGTVTLAPEAPAAQLKITADQINTVALDNYLPPGMDGQMKAGHFAMALDAGASNHPQGGVAAHLVVSDLALDDRATNTMLAKVGAFSVRVARIDPPGQTIAVDEVSSAGVSLDATRNPDGTTAALGLRMGGSARPAVKLIQAAQQLTTMPATAPATQPAVDVAAMVADARRPLPLITIGKVDLHLEHVGLHGIAGSDGKPVELANVRLYNAGPIELGGPNAEQRPPLKLQIDGGVAPVVRTFTVKLDAWPLASEPTLDLDVAAAGIDGKGLTDIVPELAKTIDGQGLTEGTFATHLSASLSYGRRGPRDVDLSRGFTAMFTVKPLEFRGQPDGPVLAGVEEVHGEGIKVEPMAGQVSIKTIDITKPMGRFVRDEQGLHALGFVIPMKAAATQPTTAPAEIAQAAPAAPPAPPKPVERPKGEFRIDHFSVSGIDLLLEDRSAPPAMIVPLKTLDLEVRDISNQMAWTGKPMRFDMLCTADTVPLPPRRGASVSGPTTRTDEGVGEMRDLFSQITATGQIRLQLTPEGQVVPVGWAKTSVNGFELLGVRGPAKVQGITIGGGVMDDRNDIHFIEDGSIETHNQIVFTNLKMSEPANGPIQKLLILPFPLDFTIGRLSDTDDSITMSVPVKIEKGALDTNAVVLPAIAAVSKVIGVAIASTPVKVVQDVGGLLGMGKGEKKPEPPVVVSFLPGIASLEGPQRLQIEQLAKRLKDDGDLELQLRHTFSQADLDQLQLRANPSADDVKLIADQLRRTRTTLVAQRNGLADQAKAQYAAQSTAADATVASVQALDRKIAQIDNSMDQFYELLRPGAARRADRRTKAASLSVAADRFELIQQTLTALGVKDVATRVHRMNPQIDPSGDRGTVTITLVPKKH